MSRQRLLIGFASLVLSACSGLGRPVVTPETPKVTGISPSGVALGVGLQIDNPNPFPLIANGLEGTLFIGNDEKVGTASTTLDAPIAAQSSGEVQSRLDIAWSSASAVRELVSKSEVPFRFQGELGVSGGPMKVSVPFELRGSFTREQLIAVGSGIVAPLLRAP